MSLPPEQIEAEALEPPSRARAQLAPSRIGSLDEDAREAGGDVERAWEEDIRRRWAEREAGTAELVPAEQVFAELRARQRE